MSGQTSLVATVLKVPGSCETPDNWKDGKVDVNQQNPKILHAVLRVGNKELVEQSFDFKAYLIGVYVCNTVNLSLLMKGGVKDLIENSITDDRNKAFVDPDIKAYGRNRDFGTSVKGSYSSLREKSLLALDKGVNSNDVSHYLVEVSTLR